MTTKFLSGFEIEKNYEDSLCPRCSQAITNPLCHTCLGEGISKWLSFYPGLKKKIMPRLKKYINEVNNSVLSAINCISCNKEKAALCPYCFTEGVLNILKKGSIPEMIVGDFLSLFNFDTDHDGYISEAIKQGIY